jgi:O-acetyl-ADP-ribose deacetylase (regulator of RNase III)
MDGGFDRDLYSFFGPSIQSRVQEAISHRPEGCLPVGASVVVRTGHSRIPFLVLAPTMTLPEEVESFNAYRAMRAVLRVARSESESFSHVFCPGLATGVGSVAPSDAADQMARAYADFTNVA